MTERQTGEQTNQRLQTTLMDSGDLNISNSGDVSTS